MRIVFLIVLILQSAITFSQVNQQYLQDPGQYGKTLEANTGMDIQGNPYYKEGWSKALASVVKGGAYVSLNKARYNVLTEQLEFDNAGKVMFLDPTVFTQFILLTGNDSLVFRNKIEGIKSIPAKAYANVAFESKNLWLIKPVKTLINDPDATYGSTKKKLIQSDESFFLIKASKEVVTFKMTVKSLSKALSIDSKKISGYLSSSGYSMDEPAHYRHIFAWLDAQL
jgi:hypothetical protein